MSQLEYRPPRDEDEVMGIATVVGNALLFPPERQRSYMDRFGPDNTRAILDGDQLVGGLGILRFGQWFGGHVVPSGGITIVGVAAHARGRGVARELMRRTLLELREDGVPLSALYPATIALYRAVGYERAGQKILYEFPMWLVPSGSHEMELHPVGPELRETVRELYMRRAQLSNGLLDRQEWSWQAHFEGVDKPVNAYLIGPLDAPEGYIMMLQPSFNEPLQVGDVCFFTERAGRRAMTLIADHRSRVTSVRLRGAPNEPLLMLFPELRDSVTQDPFLSIAWMLRITDVRGALEQRGYPGLDGSELHLDVHDTLIPENSGRYVLRISDGRAEVRPGGNGDLTISERGLAALYSGYQPPHILASLGLLNGDAATLASAARIFAGPQPWILEMF